MIRILIVGGGTGGLSTANHLAMNLRKEIKENSVKIILLNKEKRHYYQPGFLEIPFNLMRENETYRDLSRLSVNGIELISENAIKIDLDGKFVQTENQKISFDYIVIATGVDYDYERIPGLKDGTENFYDLENSIKLKQKLNSFKGGTVFVGVSSLPYKCAPAPLETVFLLNDLFRKKHIRDRVKIIYSYPIGGVFPNKGVSDFAMKLFEQKGIESRINSVMKSVDPSKKEITFENGDRISYDLAITVPPHVGAKVIRDSAIGNVDGWINVDKFTLEISGKENAFAIGDATALQVSKAGSVADAQAIVVAERIGQKIRGMEPEALYDGTGGAIFLTGMGKASMLSSNYERPPSLKPESYSFYWLKLIYNQVYWNMTAKPYLSEVME